MYQNEWYTYWIVALLMKPLAFWRLRSLALTAFRKLTFINVCIICLNIVRSYLLMCQCNRKKLYIIKKAIQIAAFHVKYVLRGIYKIKNLTVREHCWWLGHARTLHPYFSRSFSNEERVSHFYSATANVKEILNYFRSKISLSLLGLHGMIKKQHSSQTQRVRIFNNKQTSWKFPWLLIGWLNAFVVQ